MQIQLAVRKVGETYEGALIVDGRLQRVGTEVDLVILFERLVGPFLVSHMDDTQIAINVTIDPPMQMAKAGV